MAALPTSLRRTIVALGPKVNGVKVFSATLVAARMQLGEDVTEWIANHPEYAIKDIVVTQSSDSAFHCLTITVFYEERSDERARPGTKSRSQNR